LGRWVAIAADDRVVLWPMPDLDQPPAHTLPRAELLTRLHGATNCRLVEDVKSPNGWRIEWAPFSGWGPSDSAGLPTHGERRHQTAVSREE
jgi:hypothetical protein